MYVYRLQLRGRRLPRPLRGPIALRLYAGVPHHCRLLREFRLQQRLAQRGFPVAKPLFLERSSRFLGGPFLLMEWRPGETLLDLLRRKPWDVLWAPTEMAAVHVLLHQIPCKGFEPSQPFLERRFGELECIIDDCRLGGLRPGLRWLLEHRPTQLQEPPCLLHLDFHPQNLLMRDGRCVAVLDWSDADVGDRHADVATTLFVTETAPVEAVRPWDGLLTAPGRWLVKHLYLRAYRQRMPCDPARLRYFGALAALRRLATIGQWLRHGPETAGYQPGVLKRLSNSYIYTVERYFYRRTGVRASLASAAIPPSALAGPRWTGVPYAGPFPMQGLRR
jgi:aminoglycoside phosphotransferase (APT) family kinase protein